MLENRKRERFPVEGVRFCVCTEALFSQVTYALLALTRAYGAQALEWAKSCLSLIPITAVKEVERSRFLQALSEAASGADVNSLMVPVEEMSDVCRRNRNVQEIVQGCLRPLELNVVPVSSQ